MSKQCKHCGKNMPKAHPNKKFCSNKGRGNCKDSYHNNLRPESDFDYWNRFFEDVENGFHLKVSGYFGHGQE